MRRKGPYLALTAYQIDEELMSAFGAFSLDQVTPSYESAEQ